MMRSPGTMPCGVTSTPARPALCAAEPGVTSQHEHALASGQCKQALIELFVHLNAQRRTDVLTGLDELRDYAHDGVHRHGGNNPAEAPEGL